MNIYLVGGAVRDALLGLPIQDRDWVVVGATPEMMGEQGFIPVGKDFPVFLHPVSREEYALARTERKTARGYHGFAIHSAPDVTLEQDLTRRDLTINAMAVALDQLKSDGSFEPQQLIDPQHGQEDLKNRLLRHVTPAFREDPVRILRLARLAARFPDFSVASETMELVREMVQEGEADHLVAERVWQEFSRGLLAQQPSRMLDVLRDCGALHKLLPGFEPSANIMRALDLAAHSQARLAVRFACLNQVRQLGADSNFQRLWQRLRVPLECTALAELLAREQATVQRSAQLDAAALLQLLERCDALRQPQRFDELLLAWECQARASEGSEAGGESQSFPQRQRLQALLATVLALDTKDISSTALAAGLGGPQIGERIRQARLDAVIAQLERSATTN